MKNEKLYNGITGIREGLITEAEAYNFRSGKRTLKRILTIAASLVLVIGISYTGVLFFILGPSASGGTAGNNRSYMAYMGPVFPLTTLEGSEGLSATRHLTYDFISLPDSHSFPNALVTDVYTLTNITENEMTYRLAYPFVASISTGVEYIPVIQSAHRYETKLYVGKYTGGYSGVWGKNDPNGTVNLATIRSWEGYKTLLSDGTYLEDALEAFPEMTDTVIVYQISDMQVHGEGTSPTLKFSCEHDPTAVTSFAYGTRGGSYNQEEGKFSYHFGASRDDAYVFVIGGDLDTYSMQGYEDGGCDKGEEVDITATVTKTERILGEVLYELFFADRDESAISNELAFGAFAEMMMKNGHLSENPAERYRMDLTSVLADSNNVDRVMYLTFEVTIPAGESITLPLVTQKEPSIDFTGKYANRNGFDTVTALGTDIHFTEQTASIVLNTETQEIIDQNFGFDPENGVTTVILAPETEHYWMDLKMRSRETE
jgi:hypothetical protein